MAFWLGKLGFEIISGQFKDNVVERLMSEENFPPGFLSVAQQDLLLSMFPPLWIKSVFEDNGRKWTREERPTSLPKRRFFDLSVYDKKTGWYFEFIQAKEKFYVFQWTEETK